MSCKYTKLIQTYFECLHIIVIIHHHDSVLDLFYLLQHTEDVISLPFYMHLLNLLNIALKYPFILLFLYSTVYF